MSQTGRLIEIFELERQGLRTMSSKFETLFCCEKLFLFKLLVDASNCNVVCPHPQGRDDQILLAKNNN